MRHNDSSGLRGKKNKKREDLYLEIEKIKKAKVPEHVAIIMDGNGRWAKIRRKPRIFGHRAGAKAIRQVVEIAPEVGVKYLTLYAFSTENWRRPQEEVSALMKLLEEQIRNEIDELDSKNVKIKVLGHISEVPKATEVAFREAEQRTKNNTGLNLNIAINYGGRIEIVDAAKALCKDLCEKAILRNKEEKSQCLDEFLADINEETFGKYLYTSEIPDPELLIRTSGELRVSNFLLWQIAYSEIWITEKYWPDFTKLDFLEAIKDFQRRKRRFGGLSED